MDKLGETLSNVTMYDVKAYVRKAQNAVLNFSQMEAKVREATNNEPWGASTTLMQQIAEGTQSYQQFHEIMPFIYRRFTEKSASEWRQIYKALQLLEYLIKNGSERVVDYARSHTAVIDMLRHFHYVDSTGRDQGANIRNRAEELLALLSSVDKIRSERKQSRALNARTGVGSGNRTSAPDSARYGGFGAASGTSSGSLSYGGGASQQRVYGDGGGFDGSNYAGPGIIAEDEFEEYTIDENSGSGHHASTYETARRHQHGNFLDVVGDDHEAEPSSSAAAAPAAPAAVAADDDDDFDDFQSAPAAAAPTTSVPAAATNTSSILDLFSAPSSNNGAINGAPAAMPASFSTQPTSSISTANNFAINSNTQRAAAPKNDAFSNLWDMSKTAAPTVAKPAQSFAQPVSQPKPTSTTNPPKPDGDDLLLF